MKKGEGGGMPRRWQCWRRVAGRTTADLAITTKKLVIFRRREFSTPSTETVAEETIILFRSPRMPPSGHGITGGRRRAAGGFYYPHEREIFVKSEAESSAVRRENAAHSATAAARKLY